MTRETDSRAATRRIIEFLVREKQLPTPRSGGINAWVQLVERRIIDALTNRSIQPDAGRWPGGATTYELIRAVYGTDQHSAGTWPLNLAWSDAAGRGIGHLTNRLGGLEAHYGYSLDDSPGIVQEGEVVRGWLDELAYTRPDLMDRLDAEIERAIRSRQMRAKAQASA